MIAYFEGGRQTEAIWEQISYEEFIEVTKMRMEKKGHDLFCSSKA